MFRKFLVNRNAPYYGNIVRVAYELLGRAKALLPIWNRKIETSREMGYAETKAYIICGII